MNKDQIALYLDEHLEFFNDYPELLAKIKAIDATDLPLEPKGTVSLTDRIIKRAHDDKEHLKSHLDWLVEVSQANQTIQEHLAEIERLILKSSNLDQLVNQLEEEITTRFAIPHVRVCLTEGGDHFIESRLQEKCGPDSSRALKFVAPETVAAWFEEGGAPVLRGEVKDDSKVFADCEAAESIRSEALIPIRVRGEIAGAIVLGSTRAFHFYPGLRTDFLEGMAEKLAIAIDHILMIERLKTGSVTDAPTGLYNRAYLDPVLFREFDLAKRRGKSLSCIKIRIDYFSDLLDTWGNTAAETIQKSIGEILRSHCRSCDTLVRTDTDEFLALLPQIDRAGAVRVAKRVETALAGLRFPELKGFEALAMKLATASYPGDAVDSHRDLLDAVTRNLDDAEALDDQQAV